MTDEMTDQVTKPNGAPLDEVRREVLRVAKAMHAAGLVVGSAGNVSGRVDDGTVVVTPSSIGYEEMTLDDLVVVELDGTVVAGHRSATSEKDVHLASYAAYPEVGAVVHCHAKFASMFAVSHEPIPAAIDEFLVYIGGDVPICDYHPSGSAELGAEVASKLVARSGALMANHGLVTVGKSVDDAYHAALVIEHNAQIFWGARQLSGVMPLPPKHVRNFTGVYDYVRNYTWNPDRRP